MSYSGAMKFPNLNKLATHLRGKLRNNEYILLYAYGGTGKTRLSTAFKDLGKVGSPDAGTDLGDTLYFNEFIRDLFSWDNDLEYNRERRLVLNRHSRFFSGLDSMEMDNRIRPLLHRYADFDFRIDTTRWEVIFSREIRVTKNATTKEEVAGVDTRRNGSKINYEIHRKEAIKISRGEEDIFIWCFFLAIVELALDDDGSGSYNWVRFIYIDDPISSLNEHNAIAVANHLASLLKRADSRIKTVISTHHTLFFNVLWHELGKAAKRYFFKRDMSSGTLSLTKTGHTPFFNHVATLVELYEADKDNRLCTHHFNMLRAVLEKTASFHGHKHFSECIKSDPNDEDGILHTRLINILCHGNYSLFEPQEMLEENKLYFRKILQKFFGDYSFNPDLFKVESAMKKSDTI